MPAPSEEKTGISLKIDEQADQRLTESANVNHRSKRSEAYVRLSDHLSRFEMRRPLAPPSSQQKLTSVGFKMDAKTNQRLTRSAKRYEQTKHIEASIRLTDHLSKFDNHMNPRAKS